MTWTNEPEEDYTIEGRDYPIKCIQCGRFTAKEDVCWDREMGEFGSVIGYEPYCPEHKKVGM
jgi:hypothetical protein